MRRWTVGQSNEVDKHTTVLDDQTMSEVSWADPYLQPLRDAEQNMTRSGSCVVLKANLPRGFKPDGFRPLLPAECCSASNGKWFGAHDYAHWDGTAWVRAPGKCMAPTAHTHGERHPTRAPVRG